MKLSANMDVLGNRLRCKKKKKNYLRCTPLFGPPPEKRSKSATGYCFRESLVHSV